MAAYSLPREKAGDGINIIIGIERSNDFFFLLITNESDKRGRDKYNYYLNNREQH
jgi:hypothetical protein